MPLCNRCSRPHYVARLYLAAPPRTNLSGCETLRYKVGLRHSVCNMPTVLDHLFILCDAGAPEAAALARIGLIEGPPNNHPGQGTACRRFFFPRQYVELLWIEDRTEALSDATRPTRLWDRWSARRQGACPFGLVFTTDDDMTVTAPFPTRAYEPAYLPRGLAIQVAIDTPLTEPEFFFLPSRSASTGPPRPVQAALPGTSITHLRLGTPAGIPSSPAVLWATSIGLLSFERAEQFRLTVTFEGAADGGFADSTPELPLAFQW